MYLVSCWPRRFLYGWEEKIWSDWKIRVPYIDHVDKGDGSIQISTASG